MSNKSIYINEPKIDEDFKCLLPPLLREEFDQLEQNILENGCIDPIVLWNGYIVDGHNRYNICVKHNKNYLIQYLSDDMSKQDVIKWILENQLGRRNLSVAERFEIVQRYKPMFTNKAKENMSAGGKGSTTLTKVNTRKEMAKLVGISEGTYSKYDKIYDSDNDELKKKVRSGKVTVNKALEEIKSKKKKSAEKLVKPAVNINNDEESNKPIERVYDDSVKYDEFITSRQFYKCDATTKVMLLEIISQGYKKLSNTYRYDVSCDYENKMMELDKARDLLELIIW
jgi:Predicted transcriptional regulators